MYVMRSHLIIYNQLCSDDIDVTAPTNQEVDRAATNDNKWWRS